MRTRKLGALTALSAFMIDVGVPTTALGHEIEELHQHCAELVLTDDQAELQRQLEILLDEDPENACVGVLVDLIGGAPLAQVAELDAEGAVGSENDSNAIY